MESKGVVLVDKSKLTPPIFYNGDSIALFYEEENDLRIEMEKNESLFKKVLSLEQNKNNYFVNLSHELRTPLNVLCSISQLIWK